ncbi:hypothetical protein MLD38_020982 [Melastoma candidum]|uniref:Uncharacterized protein n=1 Tax=Melastoma candidum TaxID=119954 RepID=A0ACB9QEV0_9MYRT|nr:hypothetical protein MLD38_020982 [Melastoma candidum]
MVACRLKGGASAWWEGVQRRRMREGRRPVQTWMCMKQLMKGEFLPPDYKQIHFQQYQRCRQGLRIVHEYTTDFMRLARHNDLRARYANALKL